MNKIYCVKCRSKTGAMTNILTETTSINGRPMRNMLGDVCGPKKTVFTSDRSTGGKLDINSLISKLPKPKSGWAPPGYKYMGPYNPLDKQLDYDPPTGEVLKWQVKPKNKVDEISDICYDWVTIKVIVIEQWYNHLTIFLTNTCRNGVW